MNLLLMTSLSRIMSRFFFGTNSSQNEILSDLCQEWITFFPNLGRRQEIKAEIQRMEEEAEKTGDTTGGDETDGSGGDGRVWWICRICGWTG